MKKIILSFILFVQVTNISAQDLHFSQCNETPIIRNPAITGIFTGQYRLRTVFRNQWQRIRGANNASSPYRTIGLAAEVKLKGYCIYDETLVLGFQGLHDVAGDGSLTRTMALFSIGHRLPISEGLQLAGGFYGGPIYSSYNWNALQWDDQYVNDQFSPLNPTSQPHAVRNKNYFDLGGGLALTNVSNDTYSWYLGVAAHHFHQPRIAFTDAQNSTYKLPVRYAFNAGVSYDWGNFNDVILCGDAMYQGGQRQAIIGAFYRKRLMPEDDIQDKGIALKGGVLLRVGDALVPVINMNFDNWSVGVSYDINISPLSYKSNVTGAWEFSLKFRGLTNGRQDECGRTGCIAIDE